ncbi:hypothetical protein ABFS82_14G306500 [Erythranthe guttata]|uniref:Myb/SANT-like DNA-binding domain-containing protein n=1 Tax=Erythranthe guttata TaxID=4155 RepID=A0A022RD74_ERYGU|nr:PREDICTED: uncharacterized protein LOC105959637 [Erythranthe guttata]XP_012839236.1 PREDICTED: uncharacterized protein LOC105959637 [Erythranthe guttata]EYU36855.1 hypothetical protein MIMGU_mgv1a007325mg [Erythranthe guttata]|eukprot:XP_012839235.1 PREDICTED: uncharacterized protein LOC105959637 [Erythranthe guttata]
MEGDLSSRNLMQSNTSYIGFNSQVPMRVHHHQQQQQQHNNPHPKQGSSSSSMIYPTIHEKFPLPIIGTIQEDQPVSLLDYNKPNMPKSPSEDEEPSFSEEPTKGKKSSSSSPWQRVKWTDAMVRLLITAVSYISEEAAEYSGTSKRKCANLQKKGKWKSVSKVMAERGHFVSPQQCEDKFNDLNKRYKRLNEILGRGTSCEVVENPSLLEVMDHISTKAKDEVRKILSSKHLHYEEMCSYHNGNRLHLPPDPDLQHSLRLALRNDEAEVKRHHSNEDNEEVDQEDNELVHDDRAYVVQGNSAKKVKPCRGHEEFHHRGSSKSDKVVAFEGGTTKMNTVTANSWNLQIEEQRVHIEEQMLELEKERFKWQKFCQKKDRELEIMRIEIERMKLENERMALDLRRREMGIIDNN